MTRYNRINLDGKSCTQTVLTTAATKPGSLCKIDLTTGKSVAVSGDVTGIALYAANVDTLSGKAAADNIEASVSAVLDYVEQGREMAILVDKTSVLKFDTPLAVSSTAGQLKVGTPGTDLIVAYSKEQYTVASANAELVHVRFA